MKFGFEFRGFLEFRPLKFILADSKSNFQKDPILFLCVSKCGGDKVDYLRKGKYFFRKFLGERRIGKKGITQT
jgi:hypothetical protein